MLDRLCKVLLFPAKAVFEELTLESGQSGLLQSVLGQHALDSTAQNLSTAPFGKHLVHCHALQATGASVVRVVCLLEALLAGGLQVVAASNHNVVTAIGRGLVDRLVLAHQDESNRGGQTAEGTGVSARIDIVPCAGVGKTGLGVKESASRDLIWPLK